MKKYVLPVIAAAIIALLVIPTGAFAALPTNPGGIASVKTIPEDDLKRNTGVMVLGMTPYDESTGLYWAYEHLTAAYGWYQDSLCSKYVDTTYLTNQGVSSDGVLQVTPAWAGGEPLQMLALPLDPTDLDASYIVLWRMSTGYACKKYYFVNAWPNDEKPVLPGMDLLSQHKILATLNGVPTRPDYLLCEVVEKEKAKIPPMSSKTPSKRQFNDEIIKTTLTDVTSNFICKVNWIKPGVGALDVYFVGPRVTNFIADHMLIVTAGYKVNRNTIWASDVQDICILGWAMGPTPNDEEFLATILFWNSGLSTVPGQYEIYWSWPDPMGPFVSCDEAANWQLTYIVGGWPWAEN